jgi:hypothetical protein
MKRTCIVGVKCQHRTTSWKTILINDPPGKVASSEILHAYVHTWACRMWTCHMWTCLLRVIACSKDLCTYVLVELLVDPRALKFLCCRTSNCKISFCRTSCCRNSNFMLSNFILSNFILSNFILSNFKLSNYIETSVFVFCSLSFVFLTSVLVGSCRSKFSV